jgi:hypothetical protein
MKFILSIDPSGNFEEGKGHTGLAWCCESWEHTYATSINAKAYDKRLDYWNAVAAYVHKLHRKQLEGHSVHVVMEKYVTRSNGFTTGKVSETAMFIGVLTYLCELYDIPYTMQNPSQAKTRYNDIQLTKLFPNMEQRGNRFYLNNKCTNDHERDALRHLAFYKNYMED